MDHNPMFKRRHYGTPQSTLLIISNFVVFGIILTLSGKNAGWFFWIALALLALYNYSNIRKDREEYTKARIIAYILSLAAIVGMFFLFRARG